MTGEPVWLIVRIDHFQEDGYEEGFTKNPAQRLVTVTRGFRDQHAAVAHAASLSASRDPDRVEYFVASTTVDQTIDEDEDGVVVLALNRFRPGRRIVPADVTLGRVTRAQEAPPPDVRRSRECYQAVQKARLRRNLKPATA